MLTLKKYAVQLALIAFGLLCLYFGHQAVVKGDTFGHEPLAWKILGWVAIVGAIVINLWQRRKHVDGF